MKGNALGLVITTLVMAISGGFPAVAADAEMVAKVDGVMIMSDGFYGGCMAQFSQSPTSVLSACGANWLSFSCTGHALEPALAYRSLDQAQMALVRDLQVRVLFNDEQRHNGYCVASQIEVLE